MPICSTSSHWLGAGAEAVTITPKGTQLVRRARLESSADYCFCYVLISPVLTENARKAALNVCPSSIKQ